MTWGQPDKITPQWCFIESLALADRFTQGESVAEVCKELGICKESFYKACRTSPEFKAAYNRGKQQSEAWWTKLGRAGAAGKVSIQPATWVFNMKNRFNWRDKQDIKLDAEVTAKTASITSEMSQEEATRLYKELMNDE